MERRGFVTLTLCILFTLVYFKWLNPPPPPPPAKGDAAGTEATTRDAGGGAPAGANVNGAASTGPTETEPGAYAATSVPERDIPAFENQFVRVEFTARGAGIRQVFLKGYFEDLDAKIEGRADPSGWVKLLVDSGTQPRRPVLAVREAVRSGESARWRLDEVVWDVVDETLPDGRRVLVFRYDAPDGMRFEKRVECAPDRHWLGVSLRASSRDAAHRGDALNLLVTAADGIRDLERGQFTDPPRAYAASLDAYGEATLQAPFASELDDAPIDVASSEQQKLAFAGAGNLYFVALLRPETLGDAPGASLRARSAQEESVAADLQVFLRVPREDGENAFAQEDLRFFAGPKSKDLFAAEDLSTFDAIVELDYGSWESFRWINKLLLVVLGFFHGLVGNWGFAVVLLTLALRMSMFPITRMQQVSMQKYANQMMVLKPKLDQLRERYKDNAQRFAQEQMKLLKEHKVRPPVVGCLTSFITIPVFVGMFQILRSSIDLRHAEFFGWMHDLSLPDALFTVPGIGIDFNVLPILATAAFLWQMSLAPKPADPQARQQQKIMMIMPLVFGVMFYGYAAGLSLYMLVSSLYGIFESKVIRKHFFPTPPIVPAPATASK